jgi:hypothetical protein
MSVDTLDAARVRQVLRELRFGAGARGGPAAASDGWAESVARCCDEVRVRPDEPIPTWDVAGQVVRHPGRSGPGAPITAQSLVCSCAGRACVHLASVLVVLAFADPKRGAALRAPVWEVALAPMASGPPAGAPRVGTLPPASVRYDLQPPTPGLVGLMVEASIEREGAASKRAPSTLARLRAEVAPLPEIDAELHTALQALARARRVERGPGALTRHLSRGLLALLARASDVRLAGEPVRIDASPVAPRLTASTAADGGLTLRWDPEIELHWRDAGIVLAGGRVAPLPEDLPDAVAERLCDPLPPIPPEDVERFVDRLVVSRGLDVALPADLPVVRTPDGREARLTLAEVGADAL